MKQNETKQKERYEAPVVLDISPVTVNVSGEGSPTDPLNETDATDPEG